MFRTQRADIKIILVAGEREGQGVSGKYFWRTEHVNKEFSKSELELARTERETLVLSRGNTMLWAFGEGQRTRGFYAFGFRI